MFLFKEKGKKQVLSDLRFSYFKIFAMSCLLKTNSLSSYFFFTSVLDPIITLLNPRMFVFFFDTGQNGSVSQTRMFHCFVKYNMYENISEATKGIWTSE